MPTKKSKSDSNKSANTSSSSISSTTTCSSSSSCASNSEKNVKPNSSSSSRSASSQISVDSVGIGASNPKVSAPLPDAPLRFRLMPEGSGNNLMNIYDHHVFDCVVFVIFCERHRTIALTNTTDKNRMFSWFPFVVLHDVFTWNRISRDGLAIILGKIDTSGEMDPTMATLPDYIVSWLNILRVQMPRTKRFFSRITQFVKLVVSKEFKCCQTTNRIRWVKLSDIINRNHCENIWGDEVITMSRSLCNEERVFLSEFTLDNCYPYMNDSDEASLLREVNFNVERVHELYEDYISHLYPAFHMTLSSFRCFVLKYGLLTKNDKRIDRLFHSLLGENEFVTFGQLLIGIACMDPKAGSLLAARVKFIFHYYDSETTGTFSSTQLTEMITDNETSISKEKLETKIANSIRNFGLHNSSSSLNLEQFSTALQDKKCYAQVDKALRFEKSYFEAKMIKSKTNNKSTNYNSKGSVSSKSDAPQTPSSSSGKLCRNSSSKSKSKAEHFCRYHDTKRYDYGLHAVTFDSAGRCVDPRIISDNWIHQWADAEMTQHRFSIENVFFVRSLANMFVDLVRDFKESQLNQPHSRGLFTSDDDLEKYYEHLHVLCEQVLSILRNEPKLLRLNGPLYIFGDIQGSLLDLFNYETHLFHSAPVISTTLLYLGNLTGSISSHGIECVIYLLALKVLMPSKLYLLRGRNEIRNFNQDHFRGELAEKYGDKFADKIHELINRVFDSLPLAAVIDETIFATHSGIPRLPSGKKLISFMNANYSGKAFAEMRTPEQTMPIGYEMIVNIPVTYANEEDERIEARKSNSGFVQSKNNIGYYYTRNAFETFMKHNDFDYLIRSHNPCEEGYALCYGNRCLTIYSCSKCTQMPLTNTCIVQISDSKRKIRFIQFSPATEVSCNVKSGTTTSRVSGSGSSSTSSGSGSIRVK